MACRADVITANLAADRANTPERDVDMTCLPRRADDECEAGHRLPDSSIATMAEEASTAIDMLGTCPFGPNESAIDVRPREVQDAVACDASSEEPAGLFASMDWKRPAGRGRGWEVCSM